MRESDKYKLSTYKTVSVLKKSDDTTVELVKYTLDEKLYIKKTYSSDLRQVFNCIKNISNPHIPCISEVIFTDSTIVIEQYIEGNTLESLINSGHIFDKRSVKKIIAGTLDAIDALHQCGIIHRDIKPGNIIVDGNGNSFLTDYNIARFVSEYAECDTQNLGTAGYAAPEQYGFSQSDFRTDIYAFGVTMKEIINRKNSSFFMRKAVSRCCEFDPMRRFDSVRNIKRALRAWSVFKAACLAVLCMAACALFVHLVFKPDVINEINESLLIDIPDNDIVYMTFAHNGVYKKNIGLKNGLPETDITVEKYDEGYTVVIDGKYSFDFSKDDNASGQFYKNSSIYGEIVFYDFDGDGENEIIPLLCDGVLTDFAGHALSKNYTLGWCIYKNKENEYVLADGKMFAEIEGLKIYENTEGKIYGDDLSHFELDSGKIECFPAY